MFVRLLAVAALALALWAGFAHPSGGAGAERDYVVRPGDTLWSIAAANYSGDPREGVWRLEKRNRLSGRELTAGSRIVLP